MQRAVKMNTNSQPPASVTEAERVQTASDKARCASATGSASEMVTKIIGRLLTHREMWKISRGDLKTLPSDGQLEILIKDLRKIRSIINWPKCSYCSIRPARGGNRQGSALCQQCYEHDGV